MNKINGQAVTNRDSRSKIAAEKIRNGGQSNNITPEMIEAGVMELREKTYGESLDETVIDVFIAMLTAQNPT